LLENYLKKIEKFIQVVDVAMVSTKNRSF